MISLLKQNVALVVLLVLALAVGGFVLLDRLVKRDDVSHYRLTAAFEVDGRPVTASQVYGYSCVATATGIDGTCNLRGEALRVDFGVHGSLFILMNAWAPDGPTLDKNALAGHDTLVETLLLAEATRRPVAGRALPVMVKFGDPNDPLSVETVDPAHLDTSFGAGVKLVGLRVSNATEPTQYGRIAAALPWLATLKGDRLNREADPSALAYRLHGFDFMWAG